MCLLARAQIADLESEDGKNDTMVDVVFKKALKEFRINIFNSYSTALAVSLRLASHLHTNRKLRCSSTANAVAFHNFFSFLLPDG